MARIIWVIEGRDKGKGEWEVLGARYGQMTAETDSADKNALSEMRGTGREFRAVAYVPKAKGKRARK